MRERTAGKTALATAYIRAAHQLFDAGPLLFDDAAALPLLGPDRFRGTGGHPLRLRRPLAGVAGRRSRPPRPGARAPGVLRLARRDHVPGTWGHSRHCATWPPSLPAAGSSSPTGNARGTTPAAPPALAEKVAQAEKAFVTCFHDHEPKAPLRGCGFARTCLLTPEAAALSFFTPPRADLPAPETTTIVLAASGQDA